MARFLTPSAVVLMLVRKKGDKTQILLQRRQNTGFGDGKYDLSCSGHVEKHEAMSDTVLRESLEELGISIKKAHLRLFTLIHKRDGDLTYYNGYFVCDKFDGEPRICESEKCSALEWFDIDNLPEDLLEDRRLAVKAYLEGENYIEYGW